MAMGVTKSTALSPTCTLSRIPATAPFMEEARAAAVGATPSVSTRPPAPARALRTAADFARSVERADSGIRLGEPAAASAAGRAGGVRGRGGGRRMGRRGRRAASANDSTQAPTLTPRSQRTPQKPHRTVLIVVILIIADVRVLVVALCARFLGERGFARVSARSAALQTPISPPPLIARPSKPISSIVLCLMRWGRCEGCAPRGRSRR